MDKLSLLKSAFVFEGIEEPLLLQLAGYFKSVNFKKGDIIFSEGAASDSFFIVDTGEITITKRIDTGKEKVLAVLVRGSVFGEMAFFSDSPRIANAEAKTDSALWKIERPDFLRFIEERPQAGIKILAALLKVSMDRLEQTGRELATIYQTGAIISSGRGLSGIMRDIQEELILAIPGADNAAIFLYNVFNQEFDPVAAPEGIKEISPTHPLISYLKENTSGISADGPLQFEFAMDGFLKDSKSFIIAPIIKSSAMNGFLAVWNSGKTNAFKNNHRLLLSSVAGQLAEAIENLRRQQEERDMQRLNRYK